MSSQMKKSAGVIGAGIGGIAAAIRLRLKGYRVSVFEESLGPGGKLNELSMNNFRFDAGPSLLTLPHLIDELFEEAGKPPRNFFRYTKLPLITRYFYPDGTVLNAWSDVYKFAEEVEQKLQVPAEITLSYLKQAGDLFQQTADLFIFSPFRLSQMIRHPAATAIARKPLSLLAHKSLHRHNQSLKDPRLIQLFDRYATYNGSDPYRAPATLSLISHLEHQIGAFYPEKGMYSITSSLTELAQQLGVEFHYQLKAKRIELKNNKASGIRFGPHTIPFDMVVNNTDVHYAYQNLLPGLSPGIFRKRARPSSSALIFYWPMTKQFPELDLHNIFFSADYQEEFSQIERGKISSDPTIYIYISSKKVSGDAPPGMEGWFTMINVPHNQGQDWDTLIHQARESILAKLHKMLGINPALYISGEAMLDPRLIEQRTSSLGGALYGPSSNSPFSAFFRHPNQHPKISNLFFVGGSVHPGGGIPLCLASAKIMAGYVE
jgi:diapolycopene oxygenase